MISEWFEPQCPLACALYILDLSTQSAKQEERRSGAEEKKPEGDKPL